MNEHDSERIAGLLEADGLARAADQAEADVIVLNTCCSIRKSKHPMGCPAVRYSCSETHRRVMGLVHALLSSDAYSGVAQSAAQLTVNEKVVGSSPTPGATTS